MHFLLSKEVVFFGHSGMSVAVELEICPLSKVLLVGIGYGKDVDKIFRSEQHSINNLTTKI